VRPASLYTKLFNTTLVLKVNVFDEGAISSDRWLMAVVCLFVLKRSWDWNQLSNKHVSDWFAPKL